MRNYGRAHSTPTAFSLAQSMTSSRPRLNEGRGESEVSSAIYASAQRALARVVACLDGDEAVVVWGCARRVNRPTPSG